jgi:hypothetical protein
MTTSGRRLSVVAREHHRAHLGQRRSGHVTAARLDAHGASMQSPHPGKAAVLNSVRSSGARSARAPLDRLHVRTTARGTECAHGVVHRMPTVVKARRTIDSLATAFAQPTHVSGTTIAVVRGAVTLLFRASDNAKLELGSPAAVSTVFRIGSVTKQFTSSAVMPMRGGKSRAHRHDRTLGAGPAPQLA